MKRKLWKTKSFWGALAYIAAVVAEQAGVPVGPVKEIILGLEAIFIRDGIRKAERPLDEE